MNEERVREIAKEETNSGFVSAILFASIFGVILLINVFITPQLQDAQRRIAVLEQRIQQLENRK